MDVDAIVVGAGPAGSTAARGVTARCASVLPFSIEPVVEDVITGARLCVRDGRDVTRDAGRELTYMTQRRRLDAFLVERAQERGVEFRDGQAVTDILPAPAGGF